MQPTKDRFSEVLSKSLMIGLIVFSALLLFLCYKLSPSFFLNYSPDKLLKESTIAKINNLRIFLFMLAILSSFLAICIHNYAKEIEAFFIKRKKIITNLALFLVTIIILLAIGEIAARIMLSEETSGYGVGPGSISFNQKYVHLNSDMMRDREFIIAKPDNTIRIAVIGDSFTFGSGVKNVNDTYSKVLEQGLNNLNSSKKYEVLNFGIPGYDMPQQLDAIKNQALKYSPDIIIIGYVVNDLVDVDPNIQIPQKMIEIPYVGFWLRSFSYFYYFLESRLNKLVENAGLRESYETFLIRNYNSSINKENAKEIYSEIANISQKNNISVVIAMFPMLTNLNNYSLLFTNNFANELANENKFKFIDFLSEYQKHRTKDLIVNPYDTHPNELGHKIAAKKILEIFINKTI